MIINYFVNTIVFVKDIEISKSFYTNILGMKILQDYETIVFFENHFVLHEADSILKTVFKKNKFSALKKQGKRNVILYFETNALYEFYNTIANSVKIIHEIEKQAWGQKVFRFYDPDNHIIEFGEPFSIKELKQ
jgi:catechol 2,3-dioxygenase-like lactoylglutathione lyase family enzyme